MSDLETNNSVRKNPLSHCEVCPYLTIGKYVPTQMPNGKPRIMVLGEAPGPQEAKTGIPFTGPSGNLLNKVLKHHGIDINEVIKSNVCLCRPSGPTEVPPKAAIEACSERLHTEIAESGVQYLVPVGNTAAHAVLNSKRTITSLRVGPPKTYKYDPSVKVIPTVHPAFCLRSPDNFPDFVADIGKINSVNYSGWEEPIYKVFDDPEIALQAIAILKEKTKEVVIDIEAGIEKDIDFVQPEEYQMLCIGLCYESKKAVVFGEESLKDQRVLDALDDYLSGVHIIAQNGKFDLRGLSPLLGIHKLYFDTMLASHALDERPGKHGLKDMAVEILGAPKYDDEIKQYIPKGGSYANIPRDILYKYNAYDVVCTWDLYKIFEEKMSAELRAAHDFKVRGANALIHLELAGITYDINYGIDLAFEYEQKIADLEVKFTELLGFEINPRSWQQIQKYFQSEGIRLKSTDSDHIEELQKKLVNNRNVDPKVYEFTVLLMEHRKLSKLLGTFIKGLLKRTNKGKIYTTYTLHGTTSGRLASRNPNMQNIRKINEIRNQFTVEHPDNILIQLDYKQAELRVITTLAQDEYFRGILADPSRDLFTELQKQIYGNKEVYDARRKIKSVVYGLSYGREAQSIAVELNIPLSEAVELMANFKALIPQVVAWQNSVTHRVLNGKDLVTPFGRKRSFYLITEENKRDVVNEALSYLPQSIASDICLDALCTVQPMLEGIATLRLTIHDAIVMEAHKSKADEAIEILRREMIASGQRFTDYVPFPVDISMSQRLGEL